MSDVWLPKGRAPFTPEPKPISDAQYAYLRQLLDDASWSTVHRWIEFANGYVCGGHPPGGFTRIHAIRAINMLNTGASDEYSYAFLEALTFGIDAQPEDYPSPARPIWLQRKIRRYRTQGKRTENVREREPEW